MAFFYKIWKDVLSRFMVSRRTILYFFDSAEKMKIPGAIESLSNLTVLELMLLNRSKGYWAFRDAVA